MSNATYKEVAALDPSALANVLYARDFNTVSDATVASTLVTNLGLSSVDGLSNWVAAQLTAAGANKGAKVVELLNSFAQMSADATYGAAATAWNTKVDAALALSQTTDNKGGTFEAVGVVVVSNATFTLTTSVDTKTLGAGNDTFDATNLTFGSNDIIDGGVGSDTLNITNNGTAALTLPAAVVSNVETINIRNLSATSSADGSAEVASVTVGALVAGQTITVAGETLFASAALSESAVAAALAGTAASGTGYTLTGTLTTGWEKAAGTNADVVRYTATTVGNKADLTITGNATSNIKQSNIITMGNTIDATDYYTFSVNGVSVQTAVVSTTTTAAAATAVANALNGYLGYKVATPIGATVQVVSDTALSIGSFVDGVSTNVATFSNVISPSVQTIAVTASSAVTAATYSFQLNGSTVTTGTLGADASTAATAIANAINTAYGATIATTSTSTVTVNSGSVGLAISEPIESTGTYTHVLSTTTTSNGRATTDAPVISIANGTSATSAATYATTFAATNFANATSFNSDLSTASVTITGVAKDQSVGMKGNGTVATGGLDATYGSTVAAATVNLTGGTNGGAVALTAAAATTVTLNSNGAPLTSTGLTGTNTIGTLNLGGLSTSTTNIVADSNLTTGTSAVTLASKVLNVSGGATSVTLDSDTALSASNLTTIDASGLTVGGVVLGLPTTVTSFKGGAGADTVTTAALASTAVVDAGEGTDILIIGTDTDLDTAAEGAKYINFQTVRAASGSYDASLVPSATSIQMTGAGTLSNLNATQAANVQIRTSGAYTASLISDTGSSDVLSVKLGTGSSSASALNITTGLTANGFETINLATNHGSTAATGSARTSTVAAFTADKVTAINLTGSSFAITNIATAKAVTIDGSKLAGNGSTPTNTGLTTAGDGYAGSTIIGSDFHDEFTITAEAQTYTGGADDDLFVIGGTGPAALTAADGVNDLVLSGGTNSESTTTGKDILEFKDSTITDDLTLTDANFTKISGMESLKLSNTGVLSLTTGAAFNATYADGVKITTGTIAVDKYFTLAAGLSTVAVDLTVDATSLDGANASEDITITTGSANDKVTITGDATWIGGTTGSATISISTRDGDDTISVTIGTLADDHDNQGIVITGGKGKDKVTLVKVNGGDTGSAGSLTHLGNAQFVFADLDSTTDAYDEITGFDAGNSGTTDLADNLDFAGSSNAVSAFSNSADFGTILTHSISAGVATFDDIANYTTALVITSGNLADVLGYLQANTANSGVVAFAYDSDNNGSAESTLVYHNGASGASDSLVLLKDVVLTGLTTDITEAAGYAQIS
jgi:hypothetical protein